MSKPIRVVITNIDGWEISAYEGESTVRVKNHEKTYQYSHTFYYGQHNGNGSGYSWVTATGFNIDTNKNPFKEFPIEVKNYVETYVTLLK